jgi:glycosyltransferase involved in cell wall biosynthesis
MVKNKNKKINPEVSICTPTFNRRPFYNMIIKCFLSQTYPINKMEWIIIDDGTDKIEDLVKHIPQLVFA